MSSENPPWFEGNDGSWRMCLMRAACAHDRDYWQVEGPLGTLLLESEHEAHRIRDYLNATDGRIAELKGIAIEALDAWRNEYLDQHGYAPEKMDPREQELRKLVQP